MESVRDEDCIVQPTTQHTRTVILLHGRGSNGTEFRDELFESVGSDDRSLPERLPHVRWVFPTARPRLSTVFQEIMHEWFDIYSLSDPEARQDLQIPGLVESIYQIRDILDRELKLVSQMDLFIGGISQGCAVAIHVLLSLNLSLAGFVAVSGWLPFASSLERAAEQASSDNPDKGLARFYTGMFPGLEGGKSLQLGTSVANSQVYTTPALICHGVDDDIVDVKLGRTLRDVLVKMGLTVTWREDDDCGHWIKEPEAVDGLVHFLSSN